MDPKSRKHQARLQRVRRFIQNDAIADIHSVAREVASIKGINNDALVRRNAAFDSNARFVVKCWWVVHKEAVCQGTETGIDVIEARIGQPDRYDFNIEEIPYLCVGFNFRAETVARP